MILLDDDPDEGFCRLVLFEESLLLDDAAARLTRVRPDSQRHDEERRRDDVAAERGDSADRGHVNRPSVPLLDPRSVRDRLATL